MMEVKIIDIQSFIDLITNSSSEVYITDTNVVLEVITELLNNSDYKNWEEHFYPLCPATNLSRWVVDELIDTEYEKIYGKHPARYKWEYKRFFEAVGLEFKGEYVNEEEFSALQESGIEVLRGWLEKKYPGRLYLVSKEENPMAEVEYEASIFKSLFKSSERLEYWWDYSPYYKKDYEG